MGTRIGVAVLVVLATATAGAQDQGVIEHVKAATALLYSQDASGGLRMHCTATAFDADPDQHLYRFVSAAHCVGSDRTSVERVADYANLSFYITFDDSDQKVFYRASVRSLGYQSRGDDFVELEVVSTRNWPIVPLGNERDEADGNAVLNVASPLGLGRQVFRGHISSLFIDRPVVFRDINWKGTMALQLSGTDGGSSGSAIVSVQSQAIVGFVVGTVGGTTITAIPVSRFIAFRKLVADEDYRWMGQDTD